LIEAASRNVSSQFSSLTIDGSSDHRRQGGIDGAAIGDVEPAIGEIANARREPKPHEMAQAEDMIDRAGRVGVMLADFKATFVMQQAVQNIRGFAGVSRDHVGVERRIAIGDVRVEFHARLRAIFGVVIGAGLAMPAGLEKLAVGR
jgi:hypothetical protein